MSATAGLGGDSPHIYLQVIRLAFVAMSLGVALGIYRLARVWRASEEAAAAGAAVWALAAPSIYFAHRAMSENAATFAAVWGVWASCWRARAGAARLSLDLAGRLVARPVGPVPHSDGRVRDWRARRPGRAQELARPARDLGVLSVWAVAYGAIDALAWSDAPGAAYGGWFHSAILYLRFNLIEGRAAHWGTSPSDYYAEYIFRSMPIIAACLAIGLVAGLRYAPALSVLALLFLAAHSAIPHKEFRFILPMLPLAVAATVTSFDALPRAPRLAGIGSAARRRCCLGGHVSLLDVG